MVVAQQAAAGKLAGTVRREARAAEQARIAEAREAERARDDAEKASLLLNPKSPWVKVTLARVWVDRAYYCRDMDDLYASVWLDSAGGMEMSLVAPEAGYRAVKEQEDPGKFDNSL